MKSKVSFLVPISNDDKNSYNSLNSLLNQSYKNIEILVGLNGNTKNFEKKLIKTFKFDKRIKIFGLPTKGITLALNFLIEKSRGKYLARFDSDDYCLNNRIESQINYLKKKKIDLLSSNCEVFINKELSYSHKTDFSKFVYTNPIIHPTIIAKKKIFEKFKYNSIPYAEDYELYLRLFLEGNKKFDNLSSNLIRYNLNIKNIKDFKKSYFVLLSTLMISKGFRNKININPKFFKRINLDKDFKLSYERYNNKIILGNNIFSRLSAGLYLFLFGHILIRKNILNYLYYKLNNLYIFDKRKNFNILNRKKKINISNYNPLISFVIPTFNSEYTIIKTLKSILDQTYKNIEIIIVDNSPNNKTINQINKKFSKSNKIKIIKIKRYILPAEARNIGVKNSSKFSKYISFCDADDILKKEKTKIQLSQMLEDGIEVSCTNADFYNVKNKVMTNDYYNFPFLDLNFKDLCFRNVVITSSVIISKKLFSSVKGFSESDYFYSYEDYFLWLKILQKTNIRFIDESLLIYRDNRTKSASSRSTHIIEQRIRILLYYFIRLETIKSLKVVIGNFKLLNNWIQKKIFKKKHNEYINLL